MAIIRDFHYNAIKTSSHTLIEGKGQAKKTFFITSSKRFETDKETIGGYLFQKNRHYNGKEFGTLHLFEEGEEHLFDVYGRRPALTGTYAYLKTEEGTVLEVVRPSALIFLIIVLCFLLLSAVILRSRKEKETEEPVKESAAVSETNEKGSEETVITAKVTLPDGTVKIEGIPQNILNKDTSAKDLSVSFTIFLKEKETSHLLCQGRIDEDTSEWKLDFTALDFELQSGIYEGMIWFAFPDGEEAEYPISIVISQSSGGTIALGYSPNVHIDTDKQIVTLDYRQGSSSHDSLVQVIALIEGKEIIVAESEVISENETISSLKLIKNADLTKGEHDGILRIIFLDENKKATSVHSDIEARLLVE